MKVIDSVAAGTLNEWTSARGKERNEDEERRTKA